MGGNKDPSEHKHIKTSRCGGFPTVMNLVRGAVGWGHSERVETDDVSPDERRVLRLMKPREERLVSKIPATMKPEPLD